MTENFSITREIGIDMGHRVTHHGSKCRNLHGHRYTIQTTCTGSLVTQGAQEGMVIDFGFIKDEMMNVIDDVFDHGTTLWVTDPLVATFAPDHEKELVSLCIRNKGYVSVHSLVGKLVLVPFVPTAENLARFWFNQLGAKLSERNDFRESGAELSRLDVWETPNCKASYPIS